MVKRLVEDEDSDLDRLYFDLGKKVRLRSHDYLQLCLQEQRGEKWVDIGYFTHSSYLYAAWQRYKLLYDSRKKPTEGVAITQSRELAKPYLRMSMETLFASTRIFKDFKDYERAKATKRTEAATQAGARRKKD